MELRNNTISWEQGRSSYLSQFIPLLFLGMMRLRLLCRKGIHVNSIAQRSYAPLTLVALSCLLSACSPPPVAEGAAAFDVVAEINLQNLPSRDWQLSAGTLQLSFCRNKINDALLAEAEDLNRWRLVQEASALPERRTLGLQQLAAIYQEHNVLLWQEWGTVSSQSYRLAAPADAPEPSLIDALARLGRDDAICYSAIDSSQED
ncbi:hypothetical protein [Pseudidiomarina sp.]|uniref:hypothetical protein n=1 Tax=Pseudidiomarina sp. TaxID=2081707 RepID=UPI003A975768